MRVFGSSTGASEPRSIGVVATDGHDHCVGVQILSGDHPENIAGKEFHAAIVDTKQERTVAVAVGGDDGPQRRMFVGESLDGGQLSGVDRLGVDGDESLAAPAVTTSAPRALSSSATRSRPTAEC